MVDDAGKFTTREVRRGRRYDGILLDPPKFGRGPNGEVWRLEENLAPLLADCRRLLDANSRFLVLTVYAVRMSALAIGELVKQTLGDLGGTVEMGEMAVREELRGLLLPTAIFARWSLGPSGTDCRRRHERRSSEEGDRDRRLQQQRGVSPASAHRSAEDQQRHCKWKQQGAPRAIRRGADPRSVHRLRRPVRQDRAFRSTAKPRIAASGDACREPRNAEAGSAATISRGAKVEPVRCDLADGDDPPRPCRGARADRARRRRDRARQDARSAAARR